MKNFHLNGLRPEHEMVTHRGHLIWDTLPYLNICVCVSVWILSKSDQNYWFHKSHQCPSKPKPTMNELSNPNYIKYEWTNTCDCASCKWQHKMTKIVLANDARRVSHKNLQKYTHVLAKVNWTASNRSPSKCKCKCIKWKTKGDTQRQQLIPKIKRK